MIKKEFKSYLNGIIILIKKHYSKEVPKLVPFGRRALEEVINWTVKAKDVKALIL